MSTRSFTFYCIHMNLEGKSLTELLVEGPMKPYTLGRQ